MSESEQEKNKQQSNKWSSKIRNYFGQTQEEVDEGNDKDVEYLQEQQEIAKQKYINKTKLRQQTASKKQEEYDKRSEFQDTPIDGDYINGSRIYMRHCATCHSLEEDTQVRKTAGPALGLIYGRKAGTDIHYDYSQPLVASNLIWTSRSIFYFLKDPAQFLIGAKCQGKIPNEEDRSDLIMFFKMFTKELIKNIKIRAAIQQGKQYADYDLKTKKIMSEQQNLRDGRQ